MQVQVQNIASSFSKPPRLPAGTKILFIGGKRHGCFCITSKWRGTREEINIHFSHTAIAKLDITNTISLVWRRLFAFFQFSNDGFRCNFCCSFSKNTRLWCTYTVHIADSIYTRDILFSDLFFQRGSIHLLSFRFSQPRQGRDVWEHLRTDRRAFQSHHQEQQPCVTGQWSLQGVLQ